MKEPQHPPITGSHFAMKPWQILFCLVCVVLVPALVKVMDTRRGQVETAPVVAGGTAAEEPLADSPAVGAGVVIGPEVALPPASAAHALAFTQAESALAMAEAALNAGRTREVPQNLRVALAAVEKMSFGSAQRVVTLIRTGVLYSASQPQVGAALLQQAAAELDLYSDQHEMAESIPWRSARSLHVTLGEYYLQQDRPAEAEQWLRRAVTASEPLPETPSKEIELRARLIADDLLLLANAHCAGGNSAQARLVRIELQSWCAKLTDRDASTGCQAPVKAAPC